MRAKKLILVLGACSLAVSSAPALTQAPAGQPAPPAQGQGNASRVPIERGATGAGTVAAVTAALAGLIAFTAALSHGGSSRPRPTSP